MTGKVYLQDNSVP